MGSEPLGETDDRAARGRPPRPLRWLHLIEDRVLLNVATVLMAVAMAVMCGEAVSRYGWSVSHWWAEELVRFCVIWSVLLAISGANRKGHFIRMDLLLLALGRRARLASGWLTVAIGLIFSAVLTDAAIAEVQHMQRIGMKTESNLDLPLWVVRLILPAGGVLWGLYFLGAAVRLTRGEDPFTDEVAAEADLAGRATARAED